MAVTVAGAEAAAIFGLGLELRLGAGIGDDIGARARAGGRAVVAEAGVEADMGWG